MSGYRDDDLWRPGEIAAKAIKRGDLKCALANLRVRARMAYLPVDRRALCAALQKVSTELRVLNERTKPFDFRDFDLEVRP